MYFFYSLQHYDAKFTIKGKWTIWVYEYTFLKIIFAIYKKHFVTGFVKEKKKNVEISNLPHSRHSTEIPPNTALVVAPV